LKLEELKHNIPRRMKKREKKWIQKFPENFVGKDSSEDCEERFRRIPQ
jgi:ribosomal protein L16/L10AE